MPKLAKWNREEPDRNRFFGSLEELAEAMGAAVSTVKHWDSRGLIQARRDGRWSWRDCVRRVLEWEGRGRKDTNEVDEVRPAGRAGRGGGGGGVDDRGEELEWVGDDELERLRRVKRQQAELDLAARRRELVELESVGDAVRRLFEFLRREHEAVPRRLVGVLGLPQEAEREIRREMERICREGQAEAKRLRLKHPKG